MAGAPWGGSEELWHGTAKRMRLEGHQVGVSVFQWPDNPSQVMELADLGCEVDFRPLKQGFLSRLIENRIRRSGRRGIPDATWKWLTAMAPDLVVISQGFPLEAISWMDACNKAGIRYASVIQAASEIWWPEDDLLDVMRVAYQKAAGLYFVSKSNRDLLERQLGTRLTNAAVVSNPWKVDVSACVRWPDDTGTWELACVGRMDPRAKGQDVLLEVLAMEKWRARPLRVNFYGSGPCTGSIRKLAELLGVTSVAYPGQVSSVEGIWEKNHALVLPSRFEGLPLVIVEAMLCGRMVITSDVAGNAEYLTESVTGFIAEAPTPGLLDAAMEKAWAARSDWRGMGAKARADVLGFLPADPFEAFQSKLTACL